MFMGNYVGKTINANYIGDTTYIGRICFYEDFYEYKADSVNSKINMGRIDYKDIKNISNANTFCIVPNSLLVELQDGRKFKYVVIKRKEIKKFLEEQIQKRKGGK